MLTRARMLDLEDLPVEMRNQSAAAAGSATTMEEAEKRAVIQALGETKNKALAARKLRISRARLYRLMAKYGLADDSSAEEPSDTSGPEGANREVAAGFNLRMTGAFPNQPTPTGLTSDGSAPSGPECSLTLPFP